jgi:hypothetical protein
MFYINKNQTGRLGLFFTILMFFTIANTQNMRATKFINIDLNNQLKGNGLNRIIKKDEAETPSYLLAHKYNDKLGESNTFITNVGEQNAIHMQLNIAGQVVADTSNFLVETIDQISQNISTDNRYGTLRKIGNIMCIEEILNTASSGIKALTQKHFAGEDINRGGISITTYVNPETMRGVTDTVNQIYQIIQTAQNIQTDKIIEENVFFDQGPKALGYQEPKALEYQEPLNEKQSIANLNNQTPIIEQTEKSNLLTSKESQQSNVQLNKKAVKQSKEFDYAVPVMVVLSIVIAMGYTGFIYHSNMVKKSKELAKQQEENFHYNAEFIE